VFKARDEVAAATGEPAVRLYNAANGGTVRQFEATGDFVQALAVAAPTLAAGTQDGRLRIWNTAAGTVLHTLEPSPAPTK
jgi:WD40 repeat protein